MTILFIWHYMYIKYRKSLNQPKVIVSFVEIFFKTVLYVTEESCLYVFLADILVCMTIKVEVKPSNMTRSVTTG